MIDFRYHLVSIIAIFFALATGIILGAGPFDERSEEVIADQLALIRDRNQELQNEIDTLEGDREFQETFIQAVTPRVVDGELDERRVLLVVLPGVEDQLRDSVRTDLEAAGATVPATMTIQPTWTDAESETVLDELAVELVSLSGATLPEDGDGFDRGSAVLAGALLAGPDDLEEGIDAAALAGFTEADLVIVDGDLESESNLAVVLAGPPPEDDPERRNGTLVSLAEGLDRAGSGTVVAGPAAAAAETGLLTVIRDGSGGVSTVDSTELPSARLAVVLATAEQDAGGVGHYGKVNAADGAVPEQESGES
ncbi:MAG: copper transporter [Jiangellaceae bacterium]